tara:strand:- start:89 stop:964 length:876 start_codon:yes stop_codon:yes gene_type:complete
MSALAITLVLASASMHALRDLLTKKSGDKQIFMWLFILCEIAIATPFFIYFLHKYSFPVGNAFLLILAGACIHTIYSFLLSKTLEKGDLSHVYPIIRSSPALVLIFATTFFDEQVSTIGVAGILLVVCGAYLINTKQMSIAGLTEPLRSISTERPTQLAILTMCMVTMYSLVDKQVVNFVHPIIYIYFIDCFIFLVFTPYILLHKSQSAIVQEWQTRKWSMFVNGTIALVGYILILYAFTMANVSYVTGLRQLSIVFAVLLGGHILREEHKAIRLTSAAIIFIGAAFIAIA